MSVRRGKLKAAGAAEYKNDAIARLEPSNLQLIEAEDFLEYYRAIADELSKQALKAGHPFLAYLTNMASAEAQTLRRKIGRQWAKSAA